MSNLTSKAEEFQNRGRFEFALFWASAVTLPRCFDFFTTDNFRRTAFVRGFTFVVFFVILAFLVWPLRQWQRRSGLPVLKVAWSVALLAMAFVCAWAFWKTTVPPLRPPSPIPKPPFESFLNNWLAPILFALSTATALGFSIYYAITAIRRIRELRGKPHATTGNPYLKP